MYNPQTESYELENDKPLVLLLGNIAREGILSKLQTSERQYKQKMLQSKPENWESIVDYFNHYEVSCVLAKLDNFAIHAIASNAYKEISNKLLSKISEKPNMVFVYEDILKGKLEEGEWTKYFKQPTKEELLKALDILQSYNLDLVPYARNAQITFLAESFLADTDANLMFRLYVPTGKLWSNETDTLLKLFREYLSNVTPIKVRLDQKQTDNGSIYEFHCEQPNDRKDLTTEFDEFTHFLDLCVSDQELAETLLASKDIDAKKISTILTRYSKEAKRLHLDIKHDREQKILNIRQRLESELTDNIPGDVDWETINLLVESSVPSLNNTHFSLISSASHSPSNITINVNPQIIDTVNGVVAKEINGNQNIGVQGQELFELIKKYGESKRDELTAAVYEIEDESIPKDNRLRASQKIKGFLHTIARKGTDIAVGVLQTYIEKQIGL